MQEGRSSSVTGGLPLFVPHRIADVLEHLEHRYQGQEEGYQQQTAEDSSSLECEVAHPSPRTQHSSEEPNHATSHDSISFTRACTIE